MYFVYIIQSTKTKQFYTGFTNNLDRRLQEHDTGRKSTPTTLNAGPFELIHIELVESRGEARKLEKYFKSGSGREIRKEIVESLMVAIAQR